MAKRLLPRLVNSSASGTSCARQRSISGIRHLRCVSTSASVPASVPRPEENGTLYNKLEKNVESPQRLFERLPTATLIRSVILGQIIQTSWLFKSGLYLLEKIANSKSAMLNADKNPLIRAVVYPLIYRQFCAGRNRAEVHQTIDDIKQMGYSGVILCYSKEVMAGKDSKGIKNAAKGTREEDEEATRSGVQQWREGNLTTLDAVSEGDYIGVKFTGAGQSISQGLQDGKEPCAAMQDALDELCRQAQAQNKRLWIDAEQQVYHPTIDKWTIDLMRKYNRDGRVVVLTTIQAYLKSSRQTVEEYLRLAQKEGWSLGIKLVRGAYIASDVRTKIHDTKAETDASYDGIAHDILTKSWPGLTHDEEHEADSNSGGGNSFPHVMLFLAGHNSNSVRKAAALAHRLAREGVLSEQVHYGQLQGMADDVGLELLALADQALRGSKEPSMTSQRGGSDPNETRKGLPRVYKYLAWGSIQDCLHYLVRRAVENKGAAERMNAGLAETRRELRMRLLRF